MTRIPCSIFGTDKFGEFRCGEGGSSGSGSGSGDGGGSDGDQGENPLG